MDRENESQQQEQKKKTITPEGVRMLARINQIRAMEGRVALTENPQERAALEHDIATTKEQLFKANLPEKRQELEEVLALIRADRERREAHLRTLSETQEPEQKNQPAQDAEASEMNFDALMEAIGAKETNGPPLTPKQETSDDFNMSDLEEALKK